MNRRHRRAQYASRASVLLNTFMMVKETPEPCLPAIVIGIRSNGIQVWGEYLEFNIPLI